MVASMLMLMVTSGLGNWNLSEKELGWEVVNDTVMGGRSQSEIKKTEDGGLLFTGKVSLENNGGFASVRSKSSSGLLESEGHFLLRVLGDGRTYTMDLRTGLMRGAFSWKQEIQTEDKKVLELKLPLADFYPTTFGKRIPIGTRLSPSAVRSLGFMLYDGKEGPFELKILKLEYVAKDKEMPKNESELIELAISRGVPLFNRGEHEACAAIYETVLKSVSLMLKKEQTDEEKIDLMSRISEADEVRDDAERAWAYRRVIDGLLEDMR